jgi:hypothetical protein
MSAVRWMAPLCLVSVLWAFSFGVNAPLASVWMPSAGCSDSLIGLNTGAYYLGIALAASGVPWAMRRFGPGALVLGMAGREGDAERQADMTASPHDADRIRHTVFPLPPFLALGGRVGLESPTPYAVDSAPANTYRLGIMQG